MATHEEMLAAVKEALLAHDGTRDAAEAERFLVMWESLVRFLSAAPDGGAPAPSEEAMMMVMVWPETDAQKAKAEAINAASWDLIRELAPPEKPAPA